MTVLAYVLLLAAAVFAVARVLRPGTLADRALGLEVALVVLVAGICVDAASRGRTTAMSAVLIVALLGFLGSVTVAAFIAEQERR